MLSLQVHLEVVTPAAFMLTEVAGEGLVAAVGGHVAHEPPARTKVHAAHRARFVLPGEGEHLVNQRAVQLHLQQRADGQFSRRAHRKGALDTHTHWGLTEHNAEQGAEREAGGFREGNGWDMIL